MIFEILSCGLEGSSHLTFRKRHPPFCNIKSVMRRQIAHLFATTLAKLLLRLGTFGMSQAYCAFAMQIGHYLNATVQFKKSMKKDRQTS